MTNYFRSGVIILSILALTGCGDSSQDSRIKDVESGSDCSDLYRYSTNSRPGFRIQDLSSTFTAADGLTRDGNGLTWNKAGTVQRILGDRYSWQYVPPSPGYLFQGQNLNIGAGGTIRWEADYEAFEADIRWELISNGNVLQSETIRYENNTGILNGTWYSKPIEAGAGLRNLEVRAYVADLKPNGENPYLQLAWVPLVRIKQIRIFHTNPKDRVSARDPSCRP